jgi:hypothetical protein
MPLQKATNGGTMTYTNQIGMGTMFPPLLIPVNKDPAKALIQQTSGPDPKKMIIPPGVLRRPAPGPKALGMIGHERMIQIRTNVEFSVPAPKLGAVLRAGGRTGAPIASFPGPGPGVVIYAKTAAQFGGPLQARIAPATPIVEFFFLGTMSPPCKHPAFGGLQATCKARLFAQFPGTLAAPGAPVGFMTTTPGLPQPMSPNVVAASIPNNTGLIAMSASLVKSAPGTTHDPANSAGFPWTTGMVRIVQPSALGDWDTVTITGMDSRVNGVGTISLVSGALSDRLISGPNANRGWMRLTVPEPGAVVGALTALAMLAACHATRRARRRL